MLESPLYKVWLKVEDKEVMVRHLIVLDNFKPPDLALPTRRPKFNPCIAQRTPVVGHGLTRDSMKEKIVKAIKYDNLNGYCQLLAENCIWID